MSVMSTGVAESRYRLASCRDQGVWHYAVIEGAEAGRRVVAWFATAEEGRRALDVIRAAERAAGRD